MMYNIEVDHTNGVLKGFLLMLNIQQVGGLQTASSNTKLL